MKLTIYKDNDPRLRKVSVDVALPLDKKHQRLLLAMVAYLKKSQDPEFAKKHHIREGVGLAAPQVGYNVNMFAIYLPKEDGKIIEHAFVNPKIISHSVKQTYLPSGEACLSVDEGYEGYVYRPYKITIKAFDLLKSDDVELIFRGFDAIVIQHEIDHLNGVLFYDRIDKENPFKVIENAESAF